MNNEYSLFKKGKKETCWNYTIHRETASSTKNITCIWQNYYIMHVLSVCRLGMESGGNSFPSGADGSKRKLRYFYHPKVGNYYFGDDDHPMKPHRIRMTNALIKHYGLLQQMPVFKPELARN